MVELMIISPHLENEEEKRVPDRMVFLLTFDSHPIQSMISIRLFLIKITFKNCPFLFYANNNISSLKCLCTISTILRFFCLLIKAEDRSKFHLNKNS